MNNENGIPSHSRLVCTYPGFNQRRLELVWFAEGAVGKFVWS